MQKIEHELDNSFLLKDESLRDKRIQCVKLKTTVYNILNKCRLSCLIEPTWGYMRHR